MPHPEGFPQEGRQTRHGRRRGWIRTPVGLPLWGAGREGGTEEPQEHEAAPGKSPGGEVPRSRLGKQMLAPTISEEVGPKATGNTKYNETFHLLKMSMPTPDHVEWLEHMRGKMNWSSLALETENNVYGPGKLKSVVLFNCDGIWANVTTVKKTRSSNETT